jgi:hypothetical protein
VSERARKFMASVSNPLLEKPISIDRLIATIDGVVKRVAPFEDG